MRPRDLLVLLGAMALLLAFGLVVFAPETHAEELPPGNGAAYEPAPATPPADRAPEPEVHEPRPGETARLDAVYHPSGRESVNTTGWTTGEIRGDIQLTASIVPQITSLQVAVEELRNPVGDDGRVTNRWSKIQPLELGIGTPTFRVRGVPFSDYGYVVSVYSPGLNGSRQTVAVNAESPLADGLKLAITPGAPFTLLLRDQDNVALTHVEVRLVPFGDPGGRPTCDARTDNYGSAVFQSVLAGDYQAHIGPAYQPLMEPQNVTIQPPARMFRGTVPQPQGQTMVVPRGVPVTVRVVDTVGYGVDGVQVQLQANDKVKLTRMEATTDLRGNAVFPHVLAGAWQITVSKQDWERRDRQINVKPEEPPPEVTFELRRIR